MKEVGYVLLLMFSCGFAFIGGFIEGGKGTIKTMRTEAVNAGVGRWIDEDNDGEADKFEWMKGEE